MPSISFDTNRKEIEIIRDGINVGSIYFSPSDSAILSRMRKVRDQLEAVMPKIDAEMSLDDALDEAERAEKQIREWIDYIFDYPCSDVVFGSSFSFSTNEGISSLEQFLNGALGIITAAIDEEAEKAKKHQDKYLAKYKK